MSAPVISTRRIPSGVPGFDEALQGGLPRDTLLLIEGPPGSGKTTFGLQFLLQGVRDGGTCLLATNAESLEQLKSIAASHGWNLDGIHITEFTEAAGTDDDKGADYTLFPEAEVELGETLQHLFAEIERLRPTLLVLDTISVLRVLAPTPAFYRRQLCRNTAQHLVASVVPIAVVEFLEVVHIHHSDGILAPQLQQFFVK